MWGAQLYISTLIIGIAIDSCLVRILIVDLGILNLKKNKYKMQR
jgi:hypothetical protein